MDMDIQTAIEIIAEIKYQFETCLTEAELEEEFALEAQEDNKEAVKAIDMAIKALEKQAFFENEVSNIHSWFVDNKDCLLDSARSISGNWWDDCNIDEKIDKVDLDFMIEDLVDEIQKGILNVLDTYRGE